MRWVPVILLAGCVGSYEGEEPGVEAPEDSADAAVVADPPDAGPPPSYALAVDPPLVDLVLGERTSVAITLTSEHGYTGPVTLGLSGMPASWQASFSPAPVVTLAPGAVATATLELVIPTDGEAMSANVEITATQGALAEAAAVTVTVEPELIMRVPINAVNMGAEAFGNGATTVRYFAPGTRITWVNEDVVPHRIHADGINGLDHQDDDMAPGGGSYTVTINAPGTYGYSCHIHPNMTGVLVVSEP